LEAFFEQLNVSIRLSSTFILLAAQRLNPTMFSRYDCAKEQRWCYLLFLIKLNIDELRDDIKRMKVRKEIPPIHIVKKKENQK